MVTQADITAAATSLGLEGKPLEVHSSLKSFGSVEGGAASVVDGLLDASCTVLVPTFSTFHYAMAQPLDRPDLCFQRNALSELAAEQYVSPTPIYSSDSIVMNPDMGAIPAHILARPERTRGDHALNSFSAVGPVAEKLISTQRADSVYGPLATLAESDGYVVMMGVDLDRMTLLHYAEQVAGRNLFRRWVADFQGQPALAHIGSCSNGFESFAPALSEIEQRARVGESAWRVFPARATVAIAAEMIRRNPEVTRCSNLDCPRCPDAIAGGPVVSDEAVRLP